MRVRLQWCVEREDSRYNDDDESESFNDGVLRDIFLNIDTAEELKNLSIDLNHQLEKFNIG